MARILSQRLLRTERMAAMVRLCYMPVLFILALNLQTPEAWGLLAGVQALGVLTVLCGYSVYVLVASSRGSFPARLCHLSVSLDAAGAAILLYRFLGLSPTILAQAVVVATEVYFFVPIIGSLLKLAR